MSDTSEKENEAAKSVISRISKWLVGKKEENAAPDHHEPGPAPAKPTPVKESRDQKKPRPGRRRPARRAGGQKKGGGAAKSDAGPKNSQSARTRPEQKKKASRGGNGGNKPEDTESAATSPTFCKLLVNTDEPEECRIALLEDGRVEAFHLQSIMHTQTRGNIYKGRVVAVEPSLQAAFVDIGEEKNGFLPLNDIHPEYYTDPALRDKRPKDLRIDQVLKRGQEVLVQVVKEATGNKGANMTTFLSLPGRFLVLMPGSDSAGISKKIGDDKQRDKLRKIMQSLEIPEGIGYIVRTASQGLTKSALSQDLKYLLNLWEEIREKGRKARKPGLIHREQNSIARFLRDHYTQNIQEIVVDNEDAFRQVTEFLELIPANRKKTKARLHKDSRPIFNYYGIEKQIEQIYQPQVPLPSGGSIVITPTEALVAIDVNSGSTDRGGDFEESIFQANLEAAEELARQLRLRDLGGLIVVDFIDMRDNAHKRAVERRLKACLKRDKAKSDTGPISKFGLLQISRQKISSPVEKGAYRVCEHCRGRGLVRSAEALALSFLRRIQTGASDKGVKEVRCRLPLEAAEYLQNRKRQEIAELENKYQVSIDISAVPDLLPANSKVEFVRARN